MAQEEVESEEKITTDGFPKNTDIVGEARREGVGKEH